MNQENEVIEESVEQTPEQLSEILQIRREKLAELKANNNDPYQITTFGVDTYAKDIIEKFDDFDGKNVVVAGRIISWRDMGKASFIDISDRSGKIQVYIKINIVGEENYAEFGKWDIGDIVGIDGEAFKTHKGEISVKAHSLKLLSKSLRPLPEKWHGLKDTDIRYRQRYVDLIVNPEVKDTFEKRSKIIKEIRNFLDNRGYLEVETPVLHSIAGGAAARPFITHHNSLDIDMYLRIALELHLKRLIVGGFDRVYEIGRVFRNEGMDVRHNPEFTMLEFYQAYTNYIGMMDISEELIREVAQKVLGTTEVTYGEVQIDFGKAFERISMVDAVKKYADVDFDVITDLETARNLAKEHHIEFENRHGIGDILNLFFEEYVEEKLMQPTFVTGHPVEISPLAKKNAADPRYTERFELFVYGRELSNGFSELNDPIDQKERFMHQLDLKAQGDEDATDMDDDFINALEHGLPPTGGIGIGIDRLVMFLTNAASIRDVLLFPTMKPINN
ncbi:MAG: lysine--tRNA ligase [Oscillospiraceae bacterium]